LLQQYESSGRVDCQLELIRKLQQLQPVAKANSAEQREQETRLLEVIRVLQETVERLDQMVNEQLAKGTDRLQVATAAVQAGGLLKAIHVLQDDAIYVNSHPLAKVALASWLLEVGQVRDANEIFEALEAISSELTYVNWRDLAAICALTTANYDKAIRLWNEQRLASAESQTEAALQSLPFVTLNPRWNGRDSYPSTLISSTAQWMQSIRFEGSTLLLQNAFAEMEQGDVKAATRSIRDALHRNPSSSLRPLLRFYLECLTGEEIEPKPSTDEFEEIPDLGEVTAIVPKEPQSVEPGSLLPQSK